jgi:hypothetical protein
MATASRRNEPFGRPIEPVKRLIHDHRAARSPIIAASDTDRRLSVRKPTSVFLRTVCCGECSILDRIERPGDGDRRRDPAGVREETFKWRPVTTT